MARIAKEETTQTEVCHTFVPRRAQEYKNTPYYRDPPGTHMLFGCRQHPKVS